MTRLRLATNDTFRSLKIRNFRLFFGGQMISQIGNWLTLIAQTLLVLKLTDSGIALGLLAAAQFGPVLVFGAFAGLIADRMDKRKLLFAVQVFAMVQSFALAGLAFMDRPPVWAIYVIASFGGLATAFDNPARRSFVVELVPEAEITNAVSLNSALMTGSRVIGPALGGLLVATVGFGWAFLVDGLSYIAVLAGLYLIDPTTVRKPPRAVRGKGQIRDGLRYAWSVPELRVPLIMMAIIGTLAFNFGTVLPLFAVRDLGGSDLTFSLLMSVVSVGSLVGALAAARRKDIGVRTVSTSATAFGVSMLAAGHRPEHADRLRRRHGARADQHHVHDDLDRDRAAAGRSDDARSGAGAAGHRVPRQHTDRRTHRRRCVRALRGSLGPRPGGHSHHRRRPLRLGDDQAEQGRGGLGGDHGRGGG